MLKFLLIVVTLFAIYNILKYYGVFEYVSIKRTNESIRDRNNRVKDLKRATSILSFFDFCAGFLGNFFMQGNIEESHRLYVDRLELKFYGKKYTPRELRGMYVAILILGVFLVPLGLVFKPVIILSIVCFLVFMGYQKYYDLKISDEDEIIDEYFVDLYLTMYAKLKQGSKGRLTPVMKSYINSLNLISDDKVKDTMLKLAQFLLNNLSNYEDHIAIPKLRERYNSPIIIKFCNIATQALQGVENEDNLLSFRIDLVSMKVQRMKKKSAIMQVKGERAIYLIYAILITFILVGWYSKLPF